MRFAMTCLFLTAILFGSFAHASLRYHPNCLINSNVTASAPYVLAIRSTIRPRAERISDEILQDNLLTVVDHIDFSSTHYFYLTPSSAQSRLVKPTAIALAELNDKIDSYLEGLMLAHGVDLPDYDLDCNYNSPSQQSSQDATK